MKNVLTHWRAICVGAMVVVEYIALHADAINGIIETLGKIGG